MKSLVLKMKYLSIAGILLIASCGGSKTAERVENTAEKAGQRVENTAESAANKVTAYKDEEFVEDVWEATAREMAMLKAGVASGTNGQIKSHANMMLPGSRKIANQFLAYARKKNYDMPAADTAASISITAKQGKEWDAKWSENMVDHYQKLISKFEDKQDDAKDPELKSLIDNGLTTLRAHHDMVRKLQTTTN